MFILRKSLLRLSSLDSRITVREPDKKGWKSPREGWENKTFLRVFIPKRGRAGGGGVMARSLVAWSRLSSDTKSQKWKPPLWLQINTTTCKNKSLLANQAAHKTSQRHKSIVLSANLCIFVNNASSRYGPIKQHNGRMYFLEALKLIFSWILGITLQQKATNHCVTALVII